MKGFCEGMGRLLPGDGGGNGWKEGRRKRRKSGRKAASVGVLKNNLIISLLQSLEF